MAENINCEICGTNKYNYSCPKCNIKYCSVSCYQSQNHLQCSETFYKQWVEEELKSCESQSDAKRKMLEILQRNQESDSEESLDSDDEETIPDLASRMTDVNLDDEEAVWEKLTLEEQKEFKKLIASRNILKILPDCEPWWKTKKRKTLIQDCDEELSQTESPEVPSRIPKLSELTKAQPSPNVPYMVLNVLMSYVFTVRLFKGSHKDMPVEGISTCIALSATLRCNQVFNNPFESFTAFEDDLAKCDWVEETLDKNLIMEDVTDIVNGKYENDAFFCLKSAICDLKDLCLEALVVVKENKTNHLKRFTGAPPKASLLQQIEKKMNYYLSWSVEYGASLVEILSAFS